MAHFEVINNEQGLSTFSFKDYLERKLYHCKCNPIEWAYIPDDNTSLQLTSLRGTLITPEHFGVRAYNALTKSDIFTIEQLIDKTPQELLAIRCIGILTLDEIIEELDFMGLELREQPEGE